MEFVLEGTPRVCRGRHCEVGITWNLGLNNRVRSLHLRYIIVFKRGVPLLDRYVVLWICKLQQFYRVSQKSDPNSVLLSFISISTWNFEANIYAAVQLFYRYWCMSYVIFVRDFEFADFVVVFFIVYARNFISKIFSTKTSIEDWQKRTCWKVTSN